MFLLVTSQFASPDHLLVEEYLRMRQITEGPWRLAGRDQAQAEPWKPLLTPGVELRGLPLTPEEGFIASRLDGITDLTASRSSPGCRRNASRQRWRGSFPSGRCRRPRSSTRAGPWQETSPPALDNPRFGPTQARLVAAHHRTPSGLEALAARAALAADAGVRRAFLRNPQLPAGLLRRLLGGRRLLEQHKLVVSRDVPEQTRRAARELLRARFSTAEAEERVEVIVKTEGRCLAPLAGMQASSAAAPERASGAAPLGRKTCIAAGEAVPLRGCS